jgi:hypothetical protein
LRRGGTVAAIPDDIYRELVGEFGDAAAEVAERALRSEITRHRITTAIKRGVDPATAVAEALGRDPAFLERTDRLTEQPQEPSSLEDRLRRWG